MQRNEQRRHLHLPSSSDCRAQCGTDIDTDWVSYFTTDIFGDSVSHAFSITFLIVKGAYCCPHASDDVGTHTTADSDAVGSTNCDASANTCIDATTHATANADKPSDPKTDDAKPDTFSDANADDARQRLLLAGCSWLGCSLQLLDQHVVVR